MISINRNFAVISLKTRYIKTTYSWFETQFNMSHYYIEVLLFTEETITNSQPDRVEKLHILHNDKSCLTFPITYKNLSNWKFITFDFKLLFI